MTSMLILRLFLVLLKVFLLVGLLTWPLLILRVLVVLLMLLVCLIGRRVLVLVGIFSWAVLVFLLLLGLVMSLIGGLLPTFLLIARFRIGAWMADAACPIACQPIWLACWLDIHDRSSSSSSRLVQDVWDVYRDELGVVPNDVVLALRDAVSRSAVDDFWSFWSSNAEAGLFRAYALAGGPTDAGQLCLSWKRSATYS